MSNFELMIGSWVVVLTFFVALSGSVVFVIARRSGLSTSFKSVIFAYTVKIGIPFITAVGGLVGWLQASNNAPLNKLLLLIAFVVTAFSLVHQVVDCLEMRKRKHKQMKTVTPRGFDQRIEAPSNRVI